MNIFKKLLTWYLERRKDKRLKLEVRKHVAQRYFDLDDTRHTFKTVGWLAALAMLSEEQREEFCKEWGELYPYLPLSFKAEVAKEIFDRDRKRKNDEWLSKQQEKKRTQRVAEEFRTTTISNNFYRSPTKEEQVSKPLPSDMITRHHQEDHDQRSRNSVIHTPTEQSSSRSSDCGSDYSSNDNGCSGGGSD